MNEAGMSLSSIQKKKVKMAVSYMTFLCPL